MKLKNSYHLKWITSKDLLYSTGNSAQCYMAAWMGREFGGEWKNVYVWLSLFIVHLKTTTLFISYISVENKMLRKTLIWNYDDKEITILFIYSVIFL